MTLTQITEKGIKDGEIINADINASAAIARTKLANVDLVDDSSPQLGGDLASNGNDIVFADSDKIKLGTGGDLEIFHDSSHSYITDTGTGQLRLRSNDFRVQDTSGNSGIQMLEGGAVYLYHNGSERLATTANGTVITGGTNVSMDANGAGQLQVIGSGYTGAITLDASAMHIYHNASARNIVVGINETAVARFEPAGHFKILDGDLVIGASGHGIDFSDTSDVGGMSSELLDDYEEGTFTPQVASANGLMSMNYSDQVGRYTKIGRQVTVSGFVRGQAGGTQTNIIFLTNLPFNIREAYTQCLVCDTGDWSGYVSNHSGWGGYGQINNSYIVLLSVGDKNTTGVNCSEWGTSTYVYYTMTYFTDS